MGENYATITADDDGQQFQAYSSDSSEKYYEIEIKENFEVFNLIWSPLKGDSLEAHLVCQVKNKKMCHVKVLNTGYYTFKIYTDDNNNLSGSEITLYETGLINKKVVEESIYLRPYKESIFSDGDTYRTVSLGFEDDIKIHIRYQTRLYLQAEKDYYIEYSVNGVSEFNLIFGVCVDQYQYDGLLEELFKDETNELVKSDSLLETITKRELGDKRITINANLDHRLIMHRLSDYKTIQKGVYCSFIWSMDWNNCKLSGPIEGGEYGRMIYRYIIPDMVMYIDQMLGGWIYTRLLIIREKLKGKKKSDNGEFVNGVFESSVSTGFGCLASKLVEWGVIVGVSSNAASIIVGMTISILFLCADNSDNDDSPLEQLISGLNRYIEGQDSRNSLSAPVAISMTIVRDLTKMDNKDTLTIGVSDWDGTIVNALGGKYYYGNYQYGICAENDLVEAYKGLEEFVKKKLL